MRKRQPPRVQQWPRRDVTGGLRQASRGAPAVNLVAGHRKSQMPQMHADLMRPARVNFHFHRGSLGPTLQNPIAAAGLAPFSVADGHPLAIHRVARNRGVDASAQARHPSAGNGLINLLDIAPGELRAEMKMGGVIFGRDQATAGVFVKTMNDAGPRDPADAAELPAAMVQQGVDQCVFAVARRRMHDHARRLVEHQQMFVLVEDVQRKVLCLRFGGSRLGLLKNNGFARARVMSRFDNLAVNKNVSLSQKPLDGAAREVGQFAAQINIQPFPREGCVNSK